MSDLLDLSGLERTAARLVEAARRAGADEADAVAVRGVALSVEVRLGAVEESERSEGADFGLRVFVGRRHATVTANAVSDPAALAERAVAMARAAPEDAFAGLADPTLLAQDRPDLDLVDPAAPFPDDLKDLALAAEDAARAVPGVTNSNGAAASWSLGGLVLVTSHGFCGSTLASRHSLSASAIAGEGTAMESDWDASSKTHRADLDDPAAIGRRAGERAVRRRNPRQMPTGTGTVVFEPRAARSLVGHFVGAINGAAVARRTSFLKDRLGAHVFAPGIRILDDPLVARGLASRPFDGEGVAAKPIALVEDGVLTAWILDSASARELGLTTNGRAARGVGAPSPGSTNLTLEPGAATPEELIGQVSSGVYVTGFLGRGVNGVTGDYSRGISGFRISHGQLAEPVNEMTVAGNLIDMFARLVPADDLERRFAIATPTVAIDGLAVAGR